MGEENGFWRAGRFSVSLTTSSQSVQVTRDAEPVSVVVQQKGRFKVLASPKFPWFSSRSRRHSEVESVTSPVPAPPAPSPPPASIVTKKVAIYDCFGKDQYAFKISCSIPTTSSSKSVLETGLATCCAARSSQARTTSVECS